MISKKVKFNLNNLVAITKYPNLHDYVCYLICFKEKLYKNNKI